VVKDEIMLSWIAPGQLHRRSVDSREEGEGYVRGLFPSQANLYSSDDPPTNAGSGEMEAINGAICSL